MALQRAAAADRTHHGNKVYTARRIGTGSWRLLLTAAVCCAAVSASPLRAQSGPFAGLAGRWNGGGTVTLDDGSSEHIRCQATYEVVGGPQMNLTLTCASEAYKFNLDGHVVAGANGAVEGTWHETSRNVGGNLQGHGDHGNFKMVASGPGLNADISLTTRGNRQSIVMKTDGTFRGASITLSR